MADLALPLPLVHRRIARSAWLVRAAYLLRVHSRFIRRRRFRDIAQNQAHDWILALPQSRHGG
jgi:hypothetical protein